MSGRATSSVCPSASRERVLLLTTSLLTDRMLIYSRCLRRLSTRAAVTVWATSAGDTGNAPVWTGAPARVEPFPRVGHYPEVPYNFARRLNDFVWDFCNADPSRLSLETLVRRHIQRKTIRALRIPARWLARAGVASSVEAWTEKLLQRASRSPEARDRLVEMRPSLVVTTGPFWFWEPAVVSAAKNLKIPVAALIPSWDNLSTKNRMVFRYDSYFVWSEEARRQLHAYYPESRRVPVHVVGAPQFDVFFEKERWQTREAFCAFYGFDPGRPIVVYAVGSPNFIQEHHGALDLARRVASGELGGLQMLVRPHPIHDNAEMAGMFGQFGPRVAVQATSAPRTPLQARSQNVDQISDWINTFRHADVVVNLSSTVTVDAALFDRPVVNLDYDPEPGQPNQRLVHDVNHVWTHFRPVAESGGVWLTRSADETARAVRAYLENPSLHRDGRRWIAQHVCGRVDGKSGERLADAIGGCLPTAELASDGAA
jgi:hypothetical protein